MSHEFSIQVCSRIPGRKVKWILRYLLNPASDGKVKQSLTQKPRKGPKNWYLLFFGGKNSPRIFANVTFPFN